jgi:hypothetical protein
LKKFAFALSVLAITAGAQASQVSYNFVTPLETTEINQVGSLALFNSAQGTLTGASLTLYGGATFNFTGTNNTAQAQDAFLTSYSDMSYTSSLAPLDALITGHVVTVSANSGNQTYASGQMRVFDVASLISSQYFDLSGILTSLTAAGGGNFSLGCTSQSGLNNSNLGVSSTRLTHADCGAEITYSFNGPADASVPEPTSLALVGLALAGAGFVARRKKA